MSECSQPPTSPVQWRATAKDGRSCLVVARLFFDARREACKKLGCCPSEVTLERAGGGVLAHCGKVSPRTVRKLKKQAAK